MKLKIREIAILEDVTKRQVLRYCNEGYQGHVLKTVKVGNKLLVDEGDYHEWRLACGFDEPQPEPKPQPQVEVVPDPEPEPLPSARPAHCRPACPGAPLTNIPTPLSGNWAHPDAIREHTERAARELVASFRGDSK